MPDDKIGSVLTPSQREFISGESDVDPKSNHGRALQSRIRKRIRQAAQDFSLLFQHMDEDDISKIFDVDAPDEESELRKGLQETLGFLYYATQGFHPPFEELVEDGVERAERKFNDRVVSPEFIVEEESDKIYEVVNQIKEGNQEDLAEEELRLFVEFYSRAEEFEPGIALKKYREFEEGKVLKRFSNEEEFKD